MAGNLGDANLTGNELFRLLAQGAVLGSERPENGGVWGRTNIRSKTCCGGWRMADLTRVLLSDTIHCDTIHGDAIHRDTSHRDTSHSAWRRKTAVSWRRVTLCLP